MASRIAAAAFLPADGVPDVRAHAQGWWELATPEGNAVDHAAWVGRD